MLHVPSQPGFGDVVQVAGGEAPLRHQDLVCVALGQGGGLHRLIRPADPVAVKVCVEIEHFPHIGHRLIDHQVVLIENMLGKGLLPLAHDLGAEGAGMDGEHLVYPEGLGVLPGEDPVFRQYTGIVDGAVSIAVRMDVIVVGHHHIHAALPLAFLQRVQESGKIRAEGVVAVHDLEIGAGGMLQALVDALAVAAVFLMDDPHNVREFPGVFVGDLPGVVLGAVVNNDDLHPVSPGQEALDALFHIVLRIVAGYCDRQKLHLSFSFDF